MSVAHVDVSLYVTLTVQKEQPFLHWVAIYNTQQTIKLLAAYNIQRRHFTTRIISRMHANVITYTEQATDGREGCRPAATDYAALCGQHGSARSTWAGRLATRP